MGIPIAKVTKLDGATGVVKPSSKGIIAIIAPSEKGTANQAAMYSKASIALNDFGYGALTDDAAYIMAVSGNPVVLVKGTASTAAANGTVAHTGAGSSVVTATGTPLDDFNAVATIVNGGTIGVTGITLTYSLDGGVTTSAVQALGTATAFTVPNSGVTFSFAAGTVLAGQVEAFATTGPKMNNSDLVTALEALRISALPWEMVLVTGHDATATTVTTLDTWLSAREAEGRYRGFICTAVARTSAQTEAQYATAMNTAFSAAASIRGCVCADVGDVVSALPGRGITQPRPVGLALAARVADIDYGVDPAFVQVGPVSGFALADSQRQPEPPRREHVPGASTRSGWSRCDRSIARRGRFITNANVISSQGSDYVWIQHVRTMNRACELAFDVLTQQLSVGVHKNPKTGSGGEVYIAEEDAQRIEQLVNQSLTELRSQVSDLRFSLSRTDNIGANGPVTLNGALKVSPLAYVKEFDTNASFVRTITVSS
jgi:hypothetical protein